MLHFWGYPVHKYTIHIDSLSRGKMTNSSNVRTCFNDVPGQLQISEYKNHAELSNSFINQHCPASLGVETITHYGRGDSNKVLSKEIGLKDVMTL